MKIVRAFMTLFQLALLFGIPFVSLPSVLYANPAQTSQSISSPSLPVLNNVTQVRQLTPDEAKLGYPVRLRGVVTFYYPDSGDFFFQDSTAGMYVISSERKFPLQPGHLVDLEGMSGPGDFAPVVLKPSIKILGQSPMPVAREVPLERLDSGREDSQWVEVQGIVHSATERDGFLTLEIAAGAGRLKANFLKFSANYTRLVDARVRIRGACGSLFNQKRQLIGAQLFAERLEDIMVEEPAPANPLDLSVRPINSLLQFTPKGEFGHRVRVQGLVTMQKTGRFLFIKDETGGLFVQTPQPTRLQPGDLVDLLGFPAVGEYSPVLQDATFRRIGSGLLPTPLEVTAKQALTGNHDTELVRISARVLDRVQNSAEQVLILESDQLIFNAQLEETGVGNSLAFLRNGSKVQLTGICSVQVDENREPRTFRILLRSTKDVVILELPAWWTVGRIITLLGLLAASILAVLGWVVILRRRVLKQTEMIRLRLQRETALEKRFEYVARATNDAVWDWDLLTNQVWWNEGLRTIYGYSPEQVGPDAAWSRERIHPEDQPRIESGIYTVIESGGDHWAGEYRYRRADGSYAHVFDRGYVLREASGKPVRMIGAMMDISERKRAEEDLARERNLLRTLIDNLPDYIYVKDPEGQFLIANTGMARLMGATTAEELLGKTDFDFYPDKLATQYSSDEQVILRTGQPLFNREELVRDPTGFTRWLLTTRVPLRNDLGKIVGLVGMGHDITQRKKAEVELQMAKEAAEAATRKLEATNWQLEQSIERANEMAIAAQAANSAKSEFLANMSHEIRTPMNGIIGMTELMLDTRLTAEQRDYLGMVKTSADSLLALINDILDFSKIEAGRLEFDPIDFNLRDSLGDTIKTLALRAAEKGLELICDVQPDVPEGIVGDPGRLRQIMINLVGNAIKFTEQGEVAVEVSIAVCGLPIGDSPAEGKRSVPQGKNEIQVLQTKSEVQKAQSEIDNRQSTIGNPESCLLHFSVRDTGIGIAPEKQMMIFEAFAQADGSTTRKYGGTGLGLTISSRLVSLMGGKIWVESEVGKGSTFHFTARFNLSAELLPLVAPTKPSNLRGLPVLVVDDNATNRRILVDLLTHWEMKPTAVESGPLALMALEEADETGIPFSLVLLDVHMPVMDGIALAERINARLLHKSSEFPESKIIMLTSAGQRGDAARCRELGIAAYLTKPIKQSELLQAILTVLCALPSEKERRFLVTRHTLRENQKERKEHSNVGRGRGLHILVAEDNLVNQKLAVRMLEKHGHIPVVAANGREAMKALEEQQFDLVLMDVQMPEMNGFETAKAIREYEAKVDRGEVQPHPQSTFSHHSWPFGRIPIVAMTAHAMKGDRERCVEAGMDDYVSKPIQLKQLLEVIESVAPVSSEAKESASTTFPKTDDCDLGLWEVASSEMAPGEGSLDLASALDQVEGDREILLEMAEAFLEDSPKLLSQIRESVLRQDQRTLERAAHSLKGSVGIFCASAAYEVALRLERMGREGDLTRAEEAWKELEEAIERLKPALALQQLRFDLRMSD